MSALVDVLRIVADLYLDIVLGRHLTAETLAVFAGGTEHLQLLDGTHAGERLHVAPRHAARAEHAHHRGILIRQVFDADAAVRPHPHMLQVAVVDEGERLTVLDRGQQDQPAIEPRPQAIFLLRDDAIVFGLVDDVGFHPDREISRGRASLHRAPLVVPGRIPGRNADVDARPADCLVGGKLEVGFLQCRERRLHRQQFLDHRVVDDERHGTSPARLPTPACAAILHSLRRGLPLRKRSRFCANSFFCIG